MGRSAATIRRACVVAGLTAGLAFPAAASALDAPQVFVAEGDLSSYEGDVPQALWHPLAGADVTTLSPTIGVRLQDSGSSGTAHPFKIEALSVPDGHPDQDPFYWGGGCIFAIGQLGQVGDLQQLQYEGPGAYTIRVTAFTDAESTSTHCATGGVAQTVSFRIDGRPSLRFSAPKLLAGGPAYDAHGHVLGLLETLPPLAASQQTVCAINGRVGADGSVSGQQHFQDSREAPAQIDFPAPGKWTCVARAFAGIHNEANSVRGTAWSAPVTALLQADPSVVKLRIADATAPSFALAGKLRPAAAGGVLTLHLKPARGCPKAVADETARSRIKADGSFRLTMRLAVSRSHRGKLDLALWHAFASYGGNHLVRPNAHFGNLFIGRAVGFVPGIGYLKPPAERRLQFYSGGDCIDFA
jgi:hypothetical protein